MKFLIISPPMAGALPQVIPPFELLNATAIIVPTKITLLNTAMPESTAILSDAPVHTMTSSRQFPTDEPYPPIPIISLPPSYDRSFVSLQTFLDVVQSLLDLIRQFSYTVGPTVRLRADKKEKRASTNELTTLHDSAKDQESRTATLSNYSGHLQENNQASLLNLMPKRDAQHDALTTHAPTAIEGYKPSSGTFITHFIQQFHNLAPELLSLDPKTTSQLDAILTDPNIPVPARNDLDLSIYSDQIKQFVVDLYTFERIITDPSVREDDKISILQHLLDDVPPDTELWRGQSGARSARGDASSVGSAAARTRSESTS